MELNTEVLSKIYTLGKPSTPLAFSGNITEFLSRRELKKED